MAYKTGFEGLWNWISAAAVNAVSVVYNWISSVVNAGISWAIQWLQWVKDCIVGALTSVWNSLSGAVSGLGSWLVQWIQWVYNSISGALNSVWSDITSWFNQIWGWIQNSFAWVWNQVSSAVSGLGSWLVQWIQWVYNTLSGAINAVGGAVSGGLSSVGSAISGGLNGLWGNITGFLGRLWNDVSASVNAIGGAVKGAVNTIGSWVSDLLRGMASALGTALKGVLDNIWLGLTTVAGVIANGLNEYVVKPLLGAFDWICDQVGNLLRSLYDGILSALKGAGAGTPDGVAALAVPLMLISSGGSFAVGAIGAVTGIHVVGTGAETGGLVDCIKDAFSLGEISNSIFGPLLRSAYVQPITYYYQAMFRPNVVDTGTADQMLFEENISEGEWRQTYRYQGWKEHDIDAWYKTMWREPSLLVLRNLLLDPDTNEAWVRKKMREGGLIGEDADAMVAYGRRQAVKDERSALATQTQTDFQDGVIVEADARGDLAALKLSPPEIEYRIEKCKMVIARNIRRAALKAVKNFTEADLKQEVALGLRTRSQFIGDMDTIGFSAAIAERKYTLITTSKPVTAEEKERRKTTVENKILKTNLRYEITIAREDKQAALISSEIEDNGTEYAAALDVIDTEIASIRSELAGITPALVTEPIRAKIAATQRRYERSLALLVQRETRLVADIEDAKTIMSETLDVIDVEIDAVKSEFAGVTPAVLTAPIRAKITATQRRYERSLLLLGQREIQLTEDVAATQTLMSATLDVVDVEIAYLISDLSDLGVTL